MNAWLDRLIDMGLIADAECWSTTSGVRYDVRHFSTGCGLFASCCGGGKNYLIVGRVVAGRYGDGYGDGNGRGSGRGYGGR